MCVSALNDAASPAAPTSVPRGLPRTAQHAARPNPANPTSACAVGDAATSAVVTGIVLIVSACGVFAVVFYVLGI